MQGKRKYEEIVDVTSPHPNKKLKSEQEVTEWAGPQIKIRDAAAKIEEDSGVLHFETIYNDGTRENLRLLLELKTIISIQLPNMPKVYIARLVFDDRHKSLVGIKGGKVIGGITFKCFEKEGMVKFIEVVFCAITANQQVRGYGSRLMNHLKNWSKINQFFHLLTYADDFAIGYFQRQGFTLEIELDQKHWDIGFLKYYDSATLMHCKIDPNLDYLEISSLLRTQRMAFVNKMRELSNQHLIYPGVRDFQEGSVRIDLAKLRGLKEAGWEPDEYYLLMSSDRQQQIYKQNRNLLNNIKNDDEVSWPFKAPVEVLFPDEAEKYNREVKDPIDLQSIEEKLENGFYITHEMMLADLQRMVDNCKSYNPKGSVYWDIAEKINTQYLNTKIVVPVITEAPIS
eukprot:TRINITY_DN3598_c0_g1_i1.p1 TRINITY_DN3598_c0_g1~~TRINITY_DN3598_c0_g1_i1.p1  ORF type:complete len:398 (-),score=67.39 TRINITY_DN3598_c0_g1_i1:451-1644(-)